MDPNFNGQQWQQQYSNPSEQYVHPLQQQSTGAPQYGYVPTTQQTPFEELSFQQGASQTANHGLMQQMPNQQTSPNMQVQQQPSYQHYNQGVGSVTPAPSASVESWTQTQPNAQWQTATNNATTTMTTTTTTTKSTKETQASQPQYATSSTTLDFASLVQQAPQPQPVQQQHAFNYSQTMQSGNQQQNLLPSAPDFSQLLQNNPPPPQKTVDFSQLLQTAPSPQPQVSQAPPVVRTPVPPTPAQSSKHASKSTATTTTTVVGSTSRQKAAEKGQKELRRFDQDVSDHLKRSYDGICPMGFDYYAARQGYICGGGTHFFTHDDVEAMMKYGRAPRLECVNGEPYLRQVTPPPGNGDGSGLEPLFWTAKQLSETGLGGYAVFKDPSSEWLYPFDAYKLDEYYRRLKAFRMRR